MEYWTDGRTNGKTKTKITPKEYSAKWKEPKSDIGEAKTGRRGGGGVRDSETRSRIGASSRDYPSRGKFVDTEPTRMPSRGIEGRSGGGGVRGMVHDYEER